MKCPARTCNLGRSLCRPSVRPFVRRNYDSHADKRWNVRLSEEHGFGEKGRARARRQKEAGPGHGAEHAIERTASNAVDARWAEVESSCAETDASKALDGSGGTGGEEYVTENSSTVAPTRHGSLQLNIGADIRC